MPDIQKQFLRRKRACLGSEARYSTTSKSTSNRYSFIFQILQDSSDRQDLRHAPNAMDPCRRSCVPTSPGKPDPIADPKPLEMRSSAAVFGYQALPTRFL